MMNDDDLFRDIRVSEASGSLLERILRYRQEPPVHKAVYVNRNLRMEKIQFVGFDLDWTLAPYHRIPLEQLTFEMTIDRLVDRFNYPPAIRAADFRPDFSHRGLLIDKTDGCVLKMDRHRFVRRAYLGREEIGAAERNRLYRQERIDLTRERFYHVDTLFELPEVNIFSELVELSKKGQAVLPPYPQIFRDVRLAIDSLHSDASLKSLILADLPRFLPRDPEIALTLQRMAMNNRKLLLITNSEWYYTRALCDYLFEGLLPWREAFELVVVESKKPLFFRKDRPFTEIDADGKELQETLVPEWGRVYRGGSRDGLMALLKTSGERVLYIGDHIYGDIRWTRVSSTWRTVLILSELEDEILKQSDLSQKTRRLRTLRAEIQDLGHQIDNARDVMVLLAPRDEEIRSIRKSLEDLNAEHRALRKRAAVLEEQIERTYNPTWGSMFKQGASKSLFGAQVEDFACLYTSHLSNFLRYGSTHYYRLLADPMMHEVGI